MLTTGRLAPLTLAKLNGHRVTFEPNCQRHWVIASYSWPGSWSGNRKDISDFRFRFPDDDFSVMHVDRGELYYQKYQNSAYTVMFIIDYGIY